jgi:hypothetical protein
VEALLDPEAVEDRARRKAAPAVCRHQIPAANLAPKRSGSPAARILRAVASASNGTR